MTRRIKLRESGEPVEPRFNFMSMTDVIFIILIFFISASQLKASSLKIELPAVDRPPAPASAARDEAIRIEVTADDRIFVDGEEVASAQGLDARLRQAKEKRGEAAQVRFSGDADARNGRVMEVVAALARNGLKNVDFLVTERAGRRP